MTEIGLIADGDLDAAIGWRDGRPISRREFLREASALAERLPGEGTMLNLSTDRVRFAVGFAAALWRGHTSLLPPNHLPDTIARLRARFDGTYALVEPNGDEPALPTVRHADVPAHAAGVEAIPRIDAALTAAYVLTSGSTGEPVPNAKSWGLLVRNARAEATRLAESIGAPGSTGSIGSIGGSFGASGSPGPTGSSDRSDLRGSTRSIGSSDRGDLRGASIVATVPAQHMYGFESSVLVGLHGGAAFDAGRPFYPADVAAALARVAAPRLLVTTPFHLKAIVDAGVALPALALVVCATAPLSPQLAARAERALGAPLVEIYGCTEAGQVATRRPTEGAEWRTFDGLELSGDGDAAIVSGGHVPQPTVLADVLEVVGPTRFRLLGRSNDLVNVAGKRSSIGHLNFQLNSIDGVVDGAFWLPPDAQANAFGIVRLVAFVVAPALSADDIVGALRRRVDAAFLPRRVIHVDALPREATGKLPAARLAELAARVLPR